MLRKGLGISPAVTGVGHPVNVQMTAANIGYHVSPALSLVIAGDENSAVQEVALAALAEGDARSLTGNLSFQAVGNHKIGVVASLGTVQGIAITKFLPPEDDAESPSGSIFIVGERLIDFDAERVCQTSNEAGRLTRFSVRTDDMGTDLTYAWTATGASILSGATSQQVEVQLPAEAGATVTLSVTVKRPDGGWSAGSYTFQTITSMAASLEQILCEISHIMTRPPFWIDPGDPAAKVARVVTPDDIMSLATVSGELSRVPRLR